MGLKKKIELERKQKEELETANRIKEQEELKRLDLERRQKEEDELQREKKRREEEEKIKKLEQLLESKINQQRMESESGNQIDPADMKNNGSGTNLTQESNEVENDWYWDDEKGWVLEKDSQSQQNSESGENDWYWDDNEGWIKEAPKRTNTTEQRYEEKFDHQQNYEKESNITNDVIQQQAELNKYSKRKKTYNK